MGSYTLKRAEKKKRIVELKGSVCYKCGLKSEYVSVYDLHHINPNDKDPKFNKLLDSWGWKRIEEEIKKCLLLCANCHRIIHEQERRFLNDQND